MTTKTLITNLINKATLKVDVPTVSKQKQEFYKAGVRSLLKMIQIEINKLPEEDE